MKMHFSKRGNVSLKRNLLIRFSSLIIALVIIAILTTIITGDDPIMVYATMLQGAFGTGRKIWITFQDISVLLIVSVALTPAFKMKFWNIGGEGQILAGALATAACMIILGDSVPGFILIPVMFILSVLAGALWAFIPAFCKSKWNTNETLATLMLNYIAAQIVAYFVVVWEMPKGSGKIGIINQNSNAGWLMQLFGSKYILTILIALIICIFMYIYLNHTRHGYEISVVGSSEGTARYAGMTVSKVIIRTLLLSGGLCGVAGFLLVSGINHTITTTITGGIGFTAVMISWLAKFNPFIMIPASFLIIFMDKGAGEISTQFGLNHSFSDIMTGIILFTLIACEFFINYRISFDHKMSKEEKDV